MASAQQLIRGFTRHEFSPQDSLESALLAAERADELNAICAWDIAAARLASEMSTARYAAGTPIGPLDGVPMTVKDSFSMRGVPRFHGSAVHNPPSIGQIDAAPVRRLREAGAVIFAKTTMPDFGLIGSGLSSQFGVVRNPWDPRYSPGGSSSGSGVVLAVGAGALSLGTDMGGSVRLPAAQCGLVAIKPTQGRIAYDPASYYRSAGPMARNVADVVSLLETVGVYDPADQTSLPGRFAFTGPRDNLSGIRIGLLQRVHSADTVDPEASAAAERAASIFANLGALIEPINFDLTDEELIAWDDVVMPKARAELLSAPEERRSAFLPQLARWLADSPPRTATDYVVSLAVLDRMKDRLRDLMSNVDYVLSPALAVPHFSAEGWGPSGSERPLAGVLFTMIFNHGGQPAGVVPMGLTAAGLPLSVQVAGHHHDDSGVLALLQLLESAQPPLQLPGMVAR